MNVRPPIGTSGVFDVILTGAEGLSRQTCPTGQNANACDARCGDCWICLGKTVTPSLSALAENT